MEDVALAVRPLAASGAHREEGKSFQSFEKFYSHFFS